MGVDVGVGVALCRGSNSTKVCKRRIGLPGTDAPARVPRARVPRARVPRNQCAIPTRLRGNVLNGDLFAHRCWICECPGCGPRGERGSECSVRNSNARLDAEPGQGEPHSIGEGSVAAKVSRRATGRELAHPCPDDLDTRGERVDCGRHFLVAASVTTRIVVEHFQFGTPGLGFASTHRPAHAVGARTDRSRHHTVCTEHRSWHVVADQPRPHGRNDGPVGTPDHHRTYGRRRRHRQPNSRIALRNLTDIWPSGLSEIQLRR